VDRHGRTAAWTGRNCVEWCGGVALPHVSVAGNMLANPRVVTATLESYQAGAALGLPERLMEAVEAGQAAGGDRRGRQSAAMVMVTTEDFPDLDIRVDDHADPLSELRRLLGLWRRDAAPRLEISPSRANPSGIIDLEAIEAGWARAGLSLRFRR
jgi:uncharacterized Ntn-hydrolase superfamily protein